MKAFSNGIGNGHVKQVCIFNRGLAGVGKSAYFLNGNRDCYPIFDIETFHGHIMVTIACDDKSTTTLDHRNIITVVMVIFSNIVARVARADYNCFLSLGALPGLGELR